jgi:hypothetical protein
LESRQCLIRNVAPIMRGSPRKASTVLVAAEVGVTAEPWNGESIAVLM